MVANDVKRFKRHHRECTERNFVQHESDAGFVFLYVISAYRFVQTAQKSLEARRARMDPSDFAQARLSGGVLSQYVERVRRSATQPMSLFGRPAS
jgi:hypothetical protein